MPLTGAIADRARGLIPVTFDCLEKDCRIGAAPLQAAINVAKSTVTGQVIDPTQEATLPLIVIDFVAKIAVTEIIPAGIDFWMNQATSIDSTGTSEHLSYVDRANTLERLRETLVLETRNKSLEVSKLIGFYRDNGTAVPQMSSASINPYHLTPSPEEFPRPWIQTQYS